MNTLNYPKLISFVLFFLFIFSIRIYSNPSEVSVTESPKSHVLYTNETIYIASKYDTNKDLQIWFSKCMFNDLMTFMLVGLTYNTTEIPKALQTRPPIVINESTSDNIGPIMLKQSSGASLSWFGGNHSYKEEKLLKTAYTESVECFVDNSPLTEGTDVYAKQIRILVTNKFYDPSSQIIEDSKVVGFSSAMCTERVTYLIQEGNIEVELTHEWSNSTPYIIDRYYGMQSMAKGSDVFFARGNTSDFIPKTIGINRTKLQNPNFNRFVQKGANNAWYESCYLTHEGIGNHSLLDNDKPIYLTSAKIYHHLISNKLAINGMKYTWRGVYSWVKPIEDSINLLSSIIKDSNGYTCIVDVKKPGQYEVIIPETIDLMNVDVKDNTDNMVINYSAPSKIIVSSEAPGSCYVALILKENQNASTIFQLENREKSLDTYIDTSGRTITFKEKFDHMRIFQIDGKLVTQSGKNLGETFTFSRNGIYLIELNNHFHKLLIQ